MNSSHIHLIFNHSPQIAFTLGFILLVYGLIQKSRDTIQASFLVFIMGAIGGIITYFSGESAAELIQQIPREHLNLSALEKHEEASGFALIGIVMTGLAAIQAFFFVRQNHPKLKQAVYIVLILAVIATVMAARTAYLGGLIRHTELHY